MGTRVEDYFSKNYGGKRAFLRTMFEKWRSAVGDYYVYQDVNWGAGRRLVFVCQGNICRSAYAEAKARSLGISAASFGLEAPDQGPANPRAIEVAALRGIDMAPHRTVSLQSFVAQAGDILLGMEPRHGEKVAQRALAKDIQVTLLGLWGRPKRPCIVDPYGLGVDYFQTCFGFIDQALEAIVPHLSDDSGIVNAMRHELAG